MATFLSCVVSNAMVAGCLAVFAMAVTRASRSPHVAHALWLLVLVKLVTPPIVYIPVDRFIMTSHVASTQSEHAVASEPSPDESSPTIAPPVSPLSTGLNYVTDHDRKKSTWETCAASWPQWLLTTWGIGTVVFVGVCLRRHLRLLPLIADSQAPDAALARDAKQLARQIGLRECPTLRVTDAHVCPFVTPGMRHPTVVLPRRLLSELNRDQVKSMLAHELAHIRRRDHWIRIFEICVLSLNWWNPIAWWGSRQLQQVEEECCDAWVLWVLPEKRRAYGQTLLHTVEYLTEENVTPALAGTSFQSCQLKRRIDVVMNRMVNRKMSPAACAFTVVLGTIILPVGVALGLSAASSEAAQDVGDGQASRNRNTLAEQSARARDHLLGWYKLGDRTLIPVFKVDRTYYSVMHPGIEIPLKECPEGLEWALTPSSMVGTKIGSNEKSNEVYISIVDSIREKQEESFVSGEKQPMTRVSKPSWLLDATAPPPRTHDDFLGWYQPVWCPYLRLEIRKEGKRYFTGFQMLREPDETGSGAPHGEPHELSLLPDRLGFVMKQKDGVTHHVVYNESVRRFELTSPNTHACVSRMPLARVATPSSEKESVRSPRMRIGIPFWN